jgi:hypothetical protein
MLVRECAGQACNEKTEGVTRTVRDALDVLQETGTADQITSS